MSGNGADAAPSRLARMSLQSRLLLLTVLLLAVGLSIGGLVVLVVVSRSLENQVDSQMSPLTEVVATLPPSAAHYDAETYSPNSTDPELISDLYIAYLGPDGRVQGVLRQAERGTGPVLPALSGSAFSQKVGGPIEVADKRTADRWRVFVGPRIVAGQPAGGVVVAVSMRQAYQRVRGVGSLYLFAEVVLLVLLAAAGWFAIRAGLRPLERIEETAVSIAAGDLSHRVPDVAAPHTEVGRLSAALNGMLAQIEAGFAARTESEATMRRFVANVSHELRTPLFGIRGSIELYRMGALPEPADVDRTMQRVESESARLARLVEDLMLLARLDEPGATAASGNVLLQMAPMDLRTLAADALHDVRALDATRPVALTGLDGGPPVPAPVLGDEARLRQVVTNLVGNATSHTPSGTPVRIKVGTEDEHAVLEIEDEGPGLTPEQARRVFERFYRVDGSRSRTGGGGAGLGLSIAKSLTAAHGGELGLRTEPGKGAAFRVVLPAAADSAPEPD
ncbi:HAMP domain-containing sensor histidine kinase [Nonomuraea sp. NPDC050643]|uniref:sensor histidine kinase n=1 Tax=Nonomuraea sp. NPDC050643 TaxID=3155660 RepID=UPI0033CB7BD2